MSDPAFPHWWDYLLAGLFLLVLSVGVAAVGVVLILFAGGAFAWGH